MNAQARSALMNRRRTGFTLVEMLVVIVFILILASLVVAFAPRLAERQKVARGADEVQGWMLVAKMRAKRDRIPTGIRLQPDPQNGNFIRELQYIQKPDDFSGGKITYPGTGGPITVTGLDFFGGYGPTAKDLWPVQVGDYLEIKGGGLVHRINTLVPNGFVCNTLQLASVPLNPVTATADYRIIRAPRVLTGEATLQLPKDIAIDVSWVTNDPTNQRSVYLAPASQQLSNIDQNNVPQPIDILFAPSGEVIGAGAAKFAIVLWVRDVSQDPFVLLPNGSGPDYDKPAVDPTLIAVYAKTGFIAAHPVNQDRTDYYKFVRESKSSGL